MRRTRWTEEWYSRSIYLGDEVVPEDLAGLRICWESPHLAKDPRRGLVKYQNPRSWVHLLRKDRGIPPRFKVTYIPYKRRSYGYAIS